MLKLGSFNKLMMNKKKKSGESLYMIKDQSSSKIITASFNNMHITSKRLCNGIHQFCKSNEQLYGNLKKFKLIKYCWKIGSVISWHLKK